MTWRDVLPLTAPAGAYAAQAAELLDAFRAGDEAAVDRFKWEHPSFRDAPVARVRQADVDEGDARRVLARGYGFDGWETLLAFVEEVRGQGPLRRFEDAADAVVTGDLAGLQGLLHSDPELVRARSARRHRATLLHYVAANGVEGFRQRTPPNAVEVARALLDAGADVDALGDMYGGGCSTLSMLLSSAHPAEAGLQMDLARLLVEYGAAFEGPGSAWPSAVMTALTFGYADTARGLARMGAPAESLAAASGLGMTDRVADLLPAASAGDKQVALALAAQHGQAAVVRMLLDAGADPRLHNPEGHHAHATPLHMAALNGHADAVRTLVRGGAPLDAEDTIWESTPLGWARHAGHGDIAAYLQEAGSQADG